MKNIIDSVRFGDFEMKYIKFGRGEKTLVIIPGLSVQSVIPAADAIEKQYGIFSDEFTVFLFDRRSDLPEKYSIFDIANDTVRAMNALGLRDVYLFGVSQGGMIAQAIAIEHAELVSKLALCSTTCCIDEKRFSVIGRWMSLAREGKKEELFLTFGENIYPAPVFDQYRAAFVEMAKGVTSSDVSRFIILAGSMIGFDVKDRISRIKCPVLVAGDDSDAVLGGDAAYEIAGLTGESSDVELVMYSSFGHAVYDTAPDFTKKLYDFFMK